MTLLEQAKQAELIAGGSVLSDIGECGRAGLPCGVCPECVLQASGAGRREYRCCLCGFMTDEDDIVWRGPLLTNGVCPDCDEQPRCRYVRTMQAVAGGVR